MKKLLLLISIAPSILFSQTFYTKALTYQNDVRLYYDLNPLEYDSDLSLKAQEWADYMASTDDFNVSNDNLGENIFYAEKDYIIKNNKNSFLEATLNWILERDDYSTFNQITYKNAKRVGFGVAENHEYIYVVAKYDKLYK